jgi:murein L,D-transpeptidase YafK
MLARVSSSVRHFVKILTALVFVTIVAGSLSAQELADFVLVDKSEKALYLYRNGQETDRFSVAFGGNPTGHKQQEGDGRTPEGRYLLDYKKEDSSFYRAIHISYPNARDIAAAKKEGVDPGGLIMIHGQRNGLGWLSWITQRLNWTDGCIAVTNGDMDKIWSKVAANTPIEIRE